MTKGPSHSKKCHSHQASPLKKVSACSGFPVFGAKAKANLKMLARDVVLG